LQTKLYNLFAQVIRGESDVAIQGEQDLQGAIFKITNSLGLLCNHPYPFYTKARDSQVVSQEQKKAKATLPESIIPAVLAEFVETDPECPSLSTKVELLIMILDHARAMKDKVLVFTHSIPTLDYLSELCRKQKRQFSRLDGKTPIKKRQDQIKRFNMNETEVYLISTKAGGVGLNIQGANKVVIFDFGWNPVHEQQAIGRSYRIGQTKPVSVYHFVTAGTFEQDIHGKTVFKAQLATRVVDKKNPISWGNRMTDLKHDIKVVKKEDLTPFVGKDRILDALMADSEKSGIICKVVSTETFEEEDIRAPLSAEEQKEANDLAALNSIRLTNPEEYRRRHRVFEEREFLYHLPHVVQGLPTSLDNRAVPDVGRTLDGAADGPTLSSQPCVRPRGSLVAAVWKDLATALPSSGSASVVSSTDHQTTMATNLVNREVFIQRRLLYQYLVLTHILGEMPLQAQPQQHNKPYKHTMQRRNRQVPWHKSRPTPSQLGLRFRESWSLGKSCGRSWRPSLGTLLHT
jgi:hypothetical protein